MTEDTNQALEHNEDFDDLFSLEPDTTDSREEEAPSPQTEESRQEETTPQGEIPPKEPEPAGQDQPADKPAKVTVKHLGQEVELSMEELITAAQKGLDYDHVRQERDALRSSPEIALLDRLARDAGMSREDYVAAVRRRSEEEQIAREVQKGIPEEAARRLYALEQAERQRQEAEEADAAKKQREAELSAFVKAYPEVKEFPPEVLSAISRGETPLAAYQAYENKLLKAKLAAMEKQAENRQKSPGSLKGAGVPEETDAFSQGFDDDN